MSYVQLPREHGCVLICDGCGCRRQTAVTIIKHNRADAAKAGWRRGIRPWAKNDYCEACAKDIDKVESEKKRAAAERRAKRDAKNRIEVQP